MDRCKSVTIFRSHFHQIIFCCISGVTLSNLATAFGIGGFVLFPGVTSAAQKLYQDTIGDVVKILIENSREDVVKAYNFGLRVLGLIAIWFVVLFIAESLLGLLIRILVWPFQKFVFKKRKSVEGTE